MTQCDKMIEHRKPKIVLAENFFILNIACPGDSRVADKEEGKLQRYNELKTE